jgi:hypothetical protein
MLQDDENEGLNPSMILLLTVLNRPLAQSIREYGCILTPSNIFALCPRLE